MGKRKSAKSDALDDKPSTINWTQIIVAIIGLIGTLAGVYFTYQASVVPKQPPKETNPAPTIFATADSATAETICPADMVYVPGGEFILGALDDAEADDNEKPSNRIYLDAFCIDKTEVSNFAYADFIAETHPGVSHPQNNLPVVDITWYEADEFCRWKGIQLGMNIKLPSEYQWEKAARGTDGRKYPWGDRWNDNMANAGEGKTALVSVYAYANVESRYEGLLNMAGNASEWVEDWYQESMYETLFDGTHNPQSPPGLGITPTKVVRGGYFGSTAIGARSSARDGSIPPTFSFDFIGFRCATEYFPP